MVRETIAPASKLLTMSFKSSSAAYKAAFSLLSLVAVAAQAQTVNTDQLSALKWRCVGPFRGGRVSSVSGAMGVVGTYYIGLPQGGIWKTTSAGQTWYPVGDSINNQACFGSVQVAPTDPNVIYAGSGEAIGGEGNGDY